MKRVALAMLITAGLVYLLATLFGGNHPAWGYVAAFAEAAMVGAMADWFAVVALFRHPLHLPIPHTAIIPANKQQIGNKLATFICDNFLSTPQVLAKIEEFDPAGRLALWLSQRENARHVGAVSVFGARYALDAFEDERVHTFLSRAATKGLGTVDLAGLCSDVLDTLTEGGRHQELLDEVLRQVATWIETESVQERITNAMAREVRALRWVKLDQVAARLATGKIVAAVASTISEVAGQADHPVRQHVDRYAREFIHRLKHDDALRERIMRWRADALAKPAFNRYLRSVWAQMLDWLRADLAREDSSIGRRIAAMASSLGKQLAEDARTRQWINEQITLGAPRAIERYREDIRRYIENRVEQWNTEEMTQELEHNIGRDLQFIRINGTLVGGLVGLGIHILTEFLRA